MSDPIVTSTETVVEKEPTVKVSGPNVEIVTEKVTETVTETIGPARPENWITLLVVGGVIAIGIIWTAFVLTGPKWGFFCMAVAIFEGWTLVNNRKGDTISEALWEYAHRPLIPMLGGVVIGFATGSGYLGDPETVLRALVIGGLASHFWFQGDVVYQVQK